MKRTRKPFFTLLAMMLCVALFLYAYYTKKEDTSTSVPITEKNTDNSIITSKSEPITAIIASTDTQQAVLSEPDISSTHETTDVHAAASDVPLQEYPQIPELQLQPITPSAPTETLTDNTKTRKIIIKNGITKKMLSYKHWTGKYTPSIFTIKVNDMPITEGNEQTITLENNRFTVSYRYSFMNGYRTGARTITFIVNPEAHEVNLSFAWKNTWHVLCDQASPESVQEIEFKE